MRDDLRTSTPTAPFSKGIEDDLGEHMNVGVGGLLGTAKEFAMGVVSERRRMVNQGGEGRWWLFCPRFSFPCKYPPCRIQAVKGLLNRGYGLYKLAK